jgi:hypothetical protein
MIVSESRHLVVIGAPGNVRAQYGAINSAVVPAKAGTTAENAAPLKQKKHHPFGRTGVPSAMVATPFRSTIIPYARG